MEKRKGRLFIIMGASGVGKTTLMNRFLASSRYADCVKHIVSYTTRARRQGERDGVDYHFITAQEFQKKKDAGFFLETSTHYKASYGVAYHDVVNALRDGFSVFLPIDRHGALQVRAKFPNVCIIRIASPSFLVLEERLRARGEKNSDFRLQQSKKDEESERSNPIADYVVVNDDLDDAFRCFESAVFHEIFGKSF